MVIYLERSADDLRMV